MLVAAGGGMYLMMLMGLPCHYNCDVLTNIAWMLPCTIPSLSSTELALVDISIHCRSSLAFAAWHVCHDADGPPLHLSMRKLLESVHNAIE